jgi:hypothetical protein
VGDEVNGVRRGLDLHLQVNARVFAAGKWRGLHTVGVRDSLPAINGIGHAAVATDPQFRAALAAHGYTLDATGEITQLAGYVGAFSARAAQITRNLDRYEAEWAAAHPGQQPGPALRRSWDARAWADGRPDKVAPLPGTDVEARWLAELTALRYRDRDQPVALETVPVGGLDRDGMAGQVLARLAAGRSAWNAADRCLPLLTRADVPIPVPEHIRALTSQLVLNVEADLTGRLAARADAGHRPDAHEEDHPAVAGRLDAGQSVVVAALAGNQRLLVVEGAAGAGKTTALAATQALLNRQGRGLMVVTPTLKAAKVAAAEVGTAAGSAAWLAFQHGWRWNADGVWTRLAVGQADPVTCRPYGGPAQQARLRPGDLLIVDEAGMPDQDTAALS